MRTANSVRDAAEKRGNVWRGACAACHAALAGTGGDAASARAAFILAAKEAAIFVGEGR